MAIAIKHALRRPVGRRPDHNATKPRTDGNKWPATGWLWCVLGIFGEHAWMRLRHQGNLLARVKNRRSALPR